MNLLQMNTCDLTGNGRRQDVLGGRTLFWNGLQTGVKQTTQMHINKVRLVLYIVWENIFQHVHGISDATYCFITFWSIGFCRVKSCIACHFSGWCMGDSVGLKLVGFTRCEFVVRFLKDQPNIGKYTTHGSVMVFFSTRICWQIWVGVDELDERVSSQTEKMEKHFRLKLIIQAMMRWMAVEKRQTKLRFAYKNENLELFPCWCHDF